jgi:trans-aconitate 2-methyltransferase
LNLEKILKLKVRFYKIFNFFLSHIATALESALEALIFLHKDLNPWYLPSIGEYASLLERQGFNLIYAMLFAHSTPLAETEAIMANWI